MGDSVGSLGVSVSFGKYDTDALSWEKWSTFSPNKYLEEVGKCSTPGSVAQKKAFFEAHYKKIAAMKAAEAELLLDQEKGTHSTSDDHTISAIHGSGEPLNDESMQVLESQSSTTVNSNSHKDVLVNDESMKQLLESPIKLNSNAHKLEEAVLDNDKSMKQLLESPITLKSNADKLEEAVLVNNESMKLVKQHFQVDLETEEPPQVRQQIPKEKAQNVPRKINPNKVEKNSIGTKKKPASLVPKSPETPATRLSKPKATSASSLKKASAPSSSSSSKNKNHSVSESRRVAPASLHLSMSMSSVYSDTASSVTSSRRRSLFMEQMGDKDIVKRAFKTFQNRVNQLPSSDGGPKQLPTKRPEQKTSTSMAYQKENERSKKAAEKISPARGPTWKSVSSGSLKGVGVDERRLKAGPTSVALKSNERAERRKEFFKNLEEKSNAREAERSQLSLKSKEIKDTEMKKLRQNLNFKAKRLPSFYKST
ncbi:hypothetical protein L1987_79554 [Smallanthus sonchifolius]|uniref:Uncharacterized protein n=1 Tax=Smallanthus sonchifolius TaxID=185202 RepID=A0ACB8ZGT2_9ASTR|nr:hypothetical protein L1987_79554 [Smallanthus sonchifolius]